MFPRIGKVLAPPFDGLEESAIMFGEQLVYRPGVTWEVTPDGLNDMSLPEAMKLVDAENEILRARARQLIDEAKAEITTNGFHGLLTVTCPKRGCARKWSASKNDILGELSTAAGRRDRVAPFPIAGSHPRASWKGVDGSTVFRVPPRRG